MKKVLVWITGEKEELMQEILPNIKRDRILPLTMLVGYVIDAADLGKVVYFMLKNECVITIDKFV